MAAQTKIDLRVPLQDLLDGGFKIVNVSWVPNYVVNDRKWPPMEIYRWNPRRWENWVPKMPSYRPFEIAPHPNIIGGGMASWDQDAFEEIFIVAPPDTRYGRTTLEH